MKRFTSTLLLAFWVFAFAFEAEAKRPGPRESLVMRPGKTREHFIKAELDPELISIKLDTADIDEARALLRQLSMELVTREGTLDYWYLARPITSRPGQSKRDIMEEFSVSAQENDHVIFWEHVFHSSTEKTMIPTDPLWAAQWSLKTNLSSSFQTYVVDGSSMNMDSAWDLGYSGQGVHIQYIDDGLDGSHPEFDGRFVLSASYNWVTRTSDPNDASASHGTSCAGISAGAMNNSVCGAGIAYNARVSGVRWVGLDTTATPAQALTSTAASVNICSNSWAYITGVGAFQGISSSTVDALFSLASNRIIPVFSSGNAYRQFSSCAHQGVANFPYAIMVTATNHLGVHASYASACPAAIITAPSGDDFYQLKQITGIATAQTGGTCSTVFDGTSASCPAVSGVVALMKEANPRLNVRDVQHIFSRTSVRVDPTNPTWTVNSAGVAHSNLYGFGRINPVAAVSMAKTWSGVKPVNLTSATFSSPLYRKPNKPIPDATGASVTDTVRVNLPPGSVIEHVGLFVSSSHPAPTQLSLSLTAPSGTVSQYFTAVATTTKYNFTGPDTEIFAFASPYYNGTHIESVDRAGSATLRDNCSLAAIPTVSSANSWLQLFSFNADARCNNAVDIIEEAARKGFAAVAFIGFDDFVDWKTTRQSSAVPSFFVPVWQSDAGPNVAVSTRINRLGAHIPPSGPLDYQYFGSWKHFGETPVGDWTIELKDTVAGLSGNLTDWLIQFSFVAPEAPVAAPMTPQGTPVSNTNVPLGGNRAPSALVSTAAAAAVSMPVFCVMAFMVIAAIIRV